MSELYDVTHQNVCEKGTKPMEKKSSQSVEPFLRKVPKTTWKNRFPENQFPRVVFGTFLKNGSTDWLDFFPIGLVPFSHTFWWVTS